MEVISHPHADGSRTNYHYDDAQRHVRTIDYDAEDNVTCEIHYDYDASDRVSGWRVFQPADTLLMRFERRYRPDGAIEDLQFSPDDELEWRFVEQHDDENGLQLITFDANGQMIER
ncbi:MAG: hypothetical protein R2873_16155 [Caldilineaceae bacterium]|nr:hypothetical protein [Caldilineaceae bacterium]